MFVDCQDHLGSESASRQTALRVAPVAALRMAPHRASLNIKGDPALALVPKALRRGGWKGLELHSLFPAGLCKAQFRARNPIPSLLDFSLTLLCMAALELG